jgi:mRNA interferase HigB
MRVISNKALVDFASNHPEAMVVMQAWRKIIESRNFANFAELKAAFNGTDKVDDFCVFNVGGNKFRIVASVSFSYQKLFVRHVFTHKEYDKWKP